MNNEFVKSISNRYIELFEKVSGTKFEKPDFNNQLERIEKNVLDFFK